MNLHEPKRRSFFWSKPASSLYGCRALTYFVSKPFCTCMLVRLCVFVHLFIHNILKILYSLFDFFCGIAYTRLLPYPTICNFCPVLCLFLVANKQS